MLKTLVLKFDAINWSEIKRSENFDESKSQLVLVFGQKDLISSSSLFPYLKERFPIAEIIFSSTSGEIIQNRVFDHSIVVSALQFEKTTVKAVSSHITEVQNSYQVGVKLSSELQGTDLAGILVFSDGVHINGDELVLGLHEYNGKNISITGGLAGDGADFLSTLTGHNALPSEGAVVAIGFYGTHLQIGHGSVGGWDEFGHQRVITKVEKNILYELDGKNALQLYKEYLGPYSNELPGSALLFPLSLKIESGDETLIRTILTIDEEKQSMTFAGNLPLGGKVRLMKANFDRLIDASALAAMASNKSSLSSNPEFAILISCIGRKLILQERIEEEVEAAMTVLGNQCAVAGFYSYGEISPINNSTKCELHNQTMTITTFSEN